MPDQSAIVQELYNRIGTLAPDKQAIVQELARRYNVGQPGGPAPDVSARMRADALSLAPRALTTDDIAGPSMPVAGGMALSAPVNYDAPVQGARGIARGVEQMASPGLENKAGGASKVIRGGMQVAQPLLPLAIAAAPITAPVALATGMLAGSATEGGLKAVGVPEGYANLAGDVAGLAAGSRGGDVADFAGKLPGRVVEAARLPRSGTPVQRAAVDWALEKGAPLDAAAATLNPLVRGTQELAQTTVGASTPAQRAILARNQWYAEQGRALADQAHPAPATPESAGRAIADQGVATIQGANAEANAAYARVKALEADPANTRLVPAADPAAAAAGKLDEVPLPVDMRPFKEQFTPVLDDLNRRIRLGQSQYAPAQMAVEDLVKGPDFQRASVAESNLGALKEVSRNNTLTGGVKNEAGALAAQSIPKLQSAIDDTVQSIGGADALNDLHTGRLQTRGKYAAIDLVDQFRAEPVKLFNQLTQARDGGIDLLTKVKDLAPDQMPQLGRAWLDGALDHATESGGFDHAQKLFADWQKLGDSTKELIFPDKPGLVSDLDKFFQSAKDSAALEGPSKTAKVAHIGATGTFLFANPVAGGAYVIGMNALSRLLYNPKFVRAAIGALEADASKPGAAAFAAEKLQNVAKSAGVTPTPVTATAASGPAADPALVRNAAAGLPAAAESTGKLNDVQATPPAGSPANEGDALPPAVRGSESQAVGGAPGADARANTVVRVPGESGGYKAQYKVQELSDVQASHSGANFNANPKYGLQNDRNYGNAANQAKIVNWSTPSEFDPSFHITDNPDATNGPIVTDSDGNVLGGNGRAMIMDRVYGGNAKGAAAYRQLLTDKASQFGIDPQAIAGMKRPILTRVIDDSEFAPGGGASKANAITDFNKKPTAELTPAERAIADSRGVSASTLEDVSSRLESFGPDATVAQMLEGKAGGEVLQKLISDGVITPQERAAFADANGKLTKAGRDRISQLVVGRFFRDPAQLDTIPASIRGKVERIAAPLAQAETQPGWSLTPHVQDALDLLEQARAHQNATGTLDDFVNQSGLFGKDAFAPETVALAKAMDSMTSRQLTKAARQYAADAASAGRGESLFGAPPTPEEAFQAAFHVPEKLEKRTK